MSKTKILADTVSNGNVLADGSISASEIGTGTLGVANGGTGATTLTGVLKGNGTSAISASNVSLTSEVTGTLPVANGGTGSTSLTANNVLLGNGTAALQVVAPGASGNVLTSNGTTWTSAAAPSGALTLISTTNVSGTTAANITGMNNTYDAYYIICTNFTVAGTGDTWNLRLLDSGGSPMTTNYSQGYIAPTTTNQFTSFFTGQSAYYFHINAIDSTSVAGSFMVRILRQQATASLNGTGIYTEFSAPYSGSGGFSLNATIAAGGCANSSTKDMSGVRIYSASTNWSGTVRLYGFSRT